jgi:hypothetical protein
MNWVLNQNILSELLSWPQNKKNSQRLNTEYKQEFKRFSKYRTTEQLTFLGKWSIDDNLSIHFKKSSRSWVQWPTLVIPGRKQENHNLWPVLAKKKKKS